MSPPSSTLTGYVDSACFRGRENSFMSIGIDSSFDEAEAENEVEAAADDDLAIRSLLERPEVFAHPWWREQARRGACRPRRFSASRLEQAG